MQLAHKAQPALERPLDFSPVNQYRDHLHPTFEGRLTPAAQEIQIFADRFEDLFVLAVD